MNLSPGYNHSVSQTKQARIIDGKAMAQRVRDELKLQIMALGDKRKPGLAVILVGDDPASHYYVRNKQKKCEEIGIESFKTVLPASASKKAVLEIIEKYNNDPEVDGILLQLPLPKALTKESQEIIDAISLDKDVDGLTSTNQGKLVNYQEAIEPCTPKGCMEMLKRAGVELEGAKAVVLGRSNLVGKPMATLLGRANATVTLAHSRTKNLPQELGQADIVIAAVGRKEFVKAEWLKEGSVVIDVGINTADDTVGEELKSKKLYGDVEFEKSVNTASMISPVPGGVGPMTIAMLLVNTFELYQKH